MKAASQLRSFEFERGGKIAFNCIVESGKKYSSWKSETFNKFIAIEWIRRFINVKVMANCFLLIFKLIWVYENRKTPEINFCCAFSFRMSNYVECNLNDSLKRSKKFTMLLDRLIRYWLVGLVRKLIFLVGYTKNTSLLPVDHLKFLVIYYRYCMKKTRVCQLFSYFSRFFIWSNQ